MSGTVILGYPICVKLNFECMEIKTKKYEILHKHVAHFNITHIEAVTKWNSLVVLIFILAKHILCSQKLPSFKI
jgi:hypothetical protein